MKRKLSGLEIIGLAVVHEGFHTMVFGSYAFLAYFLSFNEPVGMSCDSGEWKIWWAMINDYFDETLAVAYWLIPVLHVLNNIARFLIRTVTLTERLLQGLACNHSILLECHWSAMPYCHSIMASLHHLSSRLDGPIYFIFGGWGWFLLWIISLKNLSC